MRDVLMDFAAIVEIIVLQLPHNGQICFCPLGYSILL